MAKSMPSPSSPLNNPKDLIVQCLKRNLKTKLMVLNLSFAIPKTSLTGTNHNQYHSKEDVVLLQAFLQQLHNLKQKQKGNHIKI